MITRCNSSEVRLAKMKGELEVARAGRHDAVMAVGAGFQRLLGQVLIEVDDLVNENGGSTGSRDGTNDGPGGRPSASQ